MFLEPIDWTDVESRGCRLDGFLRASGCTAFKYGGGTQKLSWRFGRGLDLESVSGIGRETAQGWTQMVFRHSGRPRREVADEEQRRGDQRLILSTRAASGWWGLLLSDLIQYTAYIKTRRSRLLKDAASCHCPTMGVLALIRVVLSESPRKSGHPIAQKLAEAPWRTDAPIKQSYCRDFVLLR